MRNFTLEKVINHAETRMGRRAETTIMVAAGQKGASCMCIGPTLYYALHACTVRVSLLVMKTYRKEKRPEEFFFLYNVSSVPFAAFCLQNLKILFYSSTVDPVKHKAI
jgi:hypothetical protein